jgi:hypothetical protein
VKYGTMRVRIHNGRLQADVSGSAHYFSPRAQFAIKPDWEKDMVFRVSGGLYHHRRELRDAAGVVQPNVKAQQSVHFVLATTIVLKCGTAP